MALRNIVEKGDKILEKHCRPVTEFNEKLHTLLDDMAETLQKANGVGLAAPQVGVLRQIAVIDCAEEEDGEGEVFVLVNPVILEKKGECTGDEGCLSLPGKAAQVTRPEWIRFKAFDENMEPYEAEAKGLLARALCHEIDHLAGHMYTDFAEGPVHDVDYEEEEQAAKKRKKGKRKK